MERDPHLLEALRIAAAALGPKNPAPAYVRAPFPLIALPRVLQTFVKDASDAMDIAPECVATPAIAVCATAIGNTCCIELAPGWSEPSVIWAVVLMESGSLKTPAYNTALAPLRAAQQRADQEYQQALADYRKAKRSYEAETSFWKNTDFATTPNATDAPPAEPVEPKPVDLYTSDTTAEALGMLFGNNPRGLALTRDELSAFFASFGAYKGGRGGDESTYLEFYNAGSSKLNRASGKRIHAQGALSIFGTCQPGVFLKVIGANGKEKNQVENGLAARFLIAAPPSKAKRWHKAKRYNTGPYGDLIRDLLAIKLLHDDNGAITPVTLAMEPEAEACYAEFVTEHGQQTHTIQNAALRFHYSKLEGVAARLALIFRLCDLSTDKVAGRSGVQEEHILAGIALARWYGREAARVYDSCETTAERERRELLEDIRKNGGSITVREMRDKRRRWRLPETAELALRALERDGCGTLQHVDAGPEGGRATLRFTLNPEEAVPDTHDNVEPQGFPGRDVEGDIPW
jgi:hypothetical protein